MHRRPIPTPLVIPSTFLHAGHASSSRYTRQVLSPLSSPLSATTVESGNYGDDEEEDHLRNYLNEFFNGVPLAASPREPTHTANRIISNRICSAPNANPPLGFSWTESARPTSPSAIARPPNPMLKNLSSRESSIAAIVTPPPHRSYCPPTNSHPLSSHSSSLGQNAASYLGSFRNSLLSRTALSEVNKASSPAPSSSAGSHSSKWRFPPFKEDDDGDQVPPVVSNTTPLLPTKSILPTKSATQLPRSHPGPGLPHPPRANTVSEGINISNKGTPSVKSGVGRTTRSDSTPGNWNTAHMDVFERNPDLKSAAIRTKSYQLTLGQVVRKGPGPIAQGSYGEVWKGLLYNKEPSFPWRSNATEVAIKVIKLPQQDHERLLKRLFREVLPVHDLEHPNILPLTGYVMHRNEAWIVTPWQKWGNAMQYLKTNPGVNRLKLIVDIVKGLNHLHSRKPPTIHSDLKGDNILIGDDGVARLSDFGLADLLDESLEASFRTSSFLSGCIHFLAPELLAGERKTVESDIWALGGLILQIASSRLPYFYLNRMQVLSALCINQIPDVRQYGRFKHDDRLWPIIMGCWKINPKERWTASQILSYLESHFSPAERT